MLYLSPSNQITNRIGIITVVYQNTINSIKGKKTTNSTEEFFSRGIGSKADQQQILLELNVLSTNTSCTFVDSKVKYCYIKWKSIKNDRFILDIVKHGLKFGFENKSQLANFPKIHHNAQAENITNLQTSNLLRRDS